MNQRIRKLRKEVLQLSQIEFGKRIGIGGTAVSKLESGENAVTEQTSKAICREFGVDIEWLKTGEGEVFVPRDDKLLAAMDRILYEADPLQKSVFRSLAMWDETDWAALRSIMLKFVAGYDSPEAKAFLASLENKKPDA